MQSAIELNPLQAMDFLLNVAVVRPVFMWGAPGIGKSALVRRFAAAVGIECVSLLGSQLAPEDLLGIPKIDGECSRFYPPASIVRSEPYVLFLDELNASSHEIQKAFYSLILEQRIGEYCLPKGTIVIGAGNRARDAAIVKPMPSALINRLVHIHLRTDHRMWLEWAINEAVFIRGWWNTSPCAPTTCGANRPSTKKPFPPRAVGICCPTRCIRLARRLAKP